MSNTDTRLQIDYYSDLLCIWAWIAQRRLDELQHQWGERIHVRHRYLNLFADTEQRMQEQWGQRGGFEGYARHVQEAAAPFDEAPVHADVWTAVRPRSSASAQLMLKAIGLHQGELAAAQFARQLRAAFFAEGRNIGEFSTLWSLIEDQQMDRAALQALLDNGAALAALMHDYQHAATQGIKGSPTWVMNQGRQVLYGNVGYRVLHANIEEILKHPAREASWC